MNFSSTYYSQNSCKVLDESNVLYFQRQNQKSDTKLSTCYLGLPSLKPPKNCMLVSRACPRLEGQTL